MSNIARSTIATHRRREIAIKVADLLGGQQQLFRIVAEAQSDHIPCIEAWKVGVPQAEAATLGIEAPRLKKYDEQFSGTSDNPLLSLDVLAKELLPPQRDR